MNVTTLSGKLNRPPQLKLLPSGDELVNFELSVAVDQDSTRNSDRKASVPITWFSPPGWVIDLDVDDSIVLVGHVRRRFFRMGDSTQSRTEVVAQTGARAGQKRRVRTVLSKAIELIEGGEPN